MFQKQQAGFSLIELLLAASVLAVIMAGLVSAMLSCYKLDQQTKEQAAAIFTLRRVAASCHSYITSPADLSAFYTKYKVSAGYTGLPGQTETLGNLTQFGLPNVTNGTVNVECFPSEASNIFPNADLNGDGDFTDTEASFVADLAAGKVMVLPVRLSIEWTGNRGTKFRQTLDIMLGGQ